MTALVVIIALLPLALGIGTWAQLNQPLAIAVIGGLYYYVAIIVDCIAYHAPVIIQKIYSC